MTIKQILEKELADEQASYDEYLALVEVLKPYESKAITRRIASKLPAGYKLRDGHSGLEAVAPSGRNHSIIRFDDMGNFTLEKFKNFNTPYSVGAPERIEKLKGILNNPEKLKTCEKTFKSISDTYHKLKQQAKDLEGGEFDSFHNPAYYEILRSLKVSSRMLSDFRFDKDMEKMGRGGHAGLADDITKDIAWDIGIEKGWLINEKWVNNELMEKAFDLAKSEAGKYKKGGMAASGDVYYIITGNHNV